MKMLAILRQLPRNAVLARAETRKRNSRKIVVGQMTVMVTTIYRNKEDLKAAKVGKVRSPRVANLTKNISGMASPQKNEGLLNLQSLVSAALLLEGRHKNRTGQGDPQDARP